MLKEGKRWFWFDVMILAPSIQTSRKPSCLWSVRRSHDFIIHGWCSLSWRDVNGFCYDPCSQHTHIQKAKLSNQPGEAMILLFMDGVVCPEGMLMVSVMILAPSTHTSRKPSCLWSVRRTHPIIHGWCSLSWRDVNNGLCYDLCSQHTDIQEAKLSMISQEKPWFYYSWMV